MFEPQPAEFTAMTSTPARSKTSMMRRAALQCLGFASGVRHQCAAASLLWRHYDFTTERGKHANGCRIYVTEENALHATQQHTNPQARLALLA